MIYTMKKQNLLIPFFLSPAAINAENCPNIVFVLVDDMGIGDINCYYNQPKIQTPNIDKLASKSLQFMQHYSGSTVSAPSRCCLLTGKHTGNSYIRGNKGVKSEEGIFDLHLPANETAVAEVLKQKGYSTMCVGKWGLGGPKTSGRSIKALTISLAICLKEMPIDIIPNTYMRMRIRSNSVEKYIAIG